MVEDEGIEVSGMDRVDKPARVELDELVRRFRSERANEGSEYRTAMSVVAWAGDRLEEPERSFLLDSAHDAIVHGRVSPEMQLSPKASAVMGSTDPEWYMDAPWQQFPSVDRSAVYAAGLVEWERDFAQSGSLAEGATDFRSMSDHEYASWFYRDRQGELILDLMFGWVPGAIAGLVAGLIVGFITSEWLLLLPVLIGGAVLGYIATGLGHVLLERLDVGWLHLGRREHAAWGIVYFGTGPAVAVLIASIILRSAQT